MKRLEKLKVKQVEVDDKFDVLIGKMKTFHEEDIRQRNTKIDEMIRSGKINQTQIMEEFGKVN